MNINIQENGKWGYYNTLTGKIIPCIYAEESDFINGRAIVKKLPYKGRACIGTGIIDENGEEIIPLIYSQIKLCDNGLYEVWRYGGLYCYYNRDGKIVDEEGKPLCDNFQKYNLVLTISSNLYRVIDDEIDALMFNNKIIYNLHKIDSNIRDIQTICETIKITTYNCESILINMDGEFILSDFDNLDFISDRFIVFRNSHTKKYGLYDLDENCYVVNSKYDEITWLSDSLFNLNHLNNQMCIDAKKKCIVVYDGKGEQNVPLNVDWCGTFNTDYAIVILDNQYSIIGKDFNTCIPYTHNKIYDVIDHYAIIEKEGKSYIFDFINETESEPYDEIKFLGGDFFVARLDNLYGVINKKGKIEVEIKFGKDIESITGNTFKVSNESYHYIIDENRNELIDTPIGYYVVGEIVWIDKFSEGYAVTTGKNGLHGFIDKEGNIAVSCKFKGRLSPVLNGVSTYVISRIDKESRRYSWMYSRVNTNGSFVVLRNGKDFCISLECDFITNFNGDIAIALKDDKWGLIHYTGKVVVGFIYDNIEYICNNMFHAIIDKESVYINSKGEIINESDIPDENKNIHEVCPNRYLQTKKEIVKNPYGEYTKKFNRIVDEHMNVIIPYTEKNIVWNPGHIYI